MPSFMLFVGLLEIEHKQNEKGAEIAASKDEFDDTLDDFDDEISNVGNCILP
jgi:hypothetical protein